MGERAERSERNAYLARTDRATRFHRNANGHRLEAAVNAAANEVRADLEEKMLLSSKSETAISSRNHKPENSIRSELRMGGTELTDALSELAIAAGHHPEDTELLKYHQNQMERPISKRHHKSSSYTKTTEPAIDSAGMLQDGTYADSASFSNDGVSSVTTDVESRSGMTMPYYMMPQPETYMTPEAMYVPSVPYSGLMTASALTIQQQNQAVLDSLQQEELNQSLQDASEEEVGRNEARNDAVLNLLEEENEFGTEMLTEEEPESVRNLRSLNAELDRQHELEESLAFSRRRL